jgi:predicted aldo/keto reductase-like oxidoreductase
MNSMAQIEENLRTAEEGTANSLTENELAIVRQARDAYKARIKVSCTECGYCLPCPSGVEIPSCFTYYNNYSMFGKEEGYNMWISPANRASGCKECGLCEEKCPQGLPIREHLKAVKEAFGS